MQSDRLSCNDLAFAGIALTNIGNIDTFQVAKTDARLAARTDHASIARPRSRRAGAETDSKLAVARSFALNFAVLSIVPAPSRIAPTWPRRLEVLLAPAEPVRPKPARPKPPPVAQVVPKPAPPAPTRPPVVETARPVPRPVAPPIRHPHHRVRHVARRKLERRVEHHAERRVELRAAAQPEEATRPQHVKPVTTPPEKEATPASPAIEKPHPSARLAEAPERVPSPQALSSYGRTVSELLARYRQYPPLARLRGWTGAVALRLEIAPQGELVAATVQRSSGHEMLDQEALAMAKRIPRLPPPPAGSDGRPLAVRVKVVFELAPP